MSKEVPFCSFDYDSGIIEKIWTKLLLTWINNCVEPKQKITALSSEVLYEIINRYKNDVYSGTVDLAKLSTFGAIESLVEHYYPLLERNLDTPKKWYILASVLLYFCCTKSSTGVVDTDICKKLAKDAQEMILKFCEQLPEDRVTVDNVDECITEACKPVYDIIRKRQYGSESSAANVEDRSDDLSSFTSGSTESNIYKPNTMIYSESSEMYPKSIYGKYHESKISETVGDLDRIAFLQSGFSGSYRGSNFVQSTIQPPTQTNVLGLSPVSKSKVSELSYETKKTNFSDVLAQNAGTSDKQGTKIIETSSQILKTMLISDSAKLSPPRSTVQRPSGLNEPEIHGEIIEKHRTTKVIAPSSPISGRVNHLPSESPDNVIVQRSLIVVAPIENRQIEKKKYPSGQKMRTENVPSVQIGEKRPKAKELSRQSILKKTKYDANVSPTHSKLRFQSPPGSNIAVESIAKVSPSIGTEAGRKSATAYLQAAKLSAANTLLDDISTLLDDESVKRDKIDGKRVSLPEQPEESEKLKKFVAECSGSMAAGAPKKMNKRDVFHFASFLKRKRTSSPAELMEKRPKEEPNEESYKESKEKEPPPIEVDGTSSIIGRRPRRSTSEIFSQHQVALISFILGFLMIGFAMLSVFRSSYNSSPTSFKRTKEPPPSSDRLARCNANPDYYDMLSSNIPEGSSHFAWSCEKKICVKQTKASMKRNKRVYLSLSRCMLLCMGPQLWPLPIGETEFSQELVALSTERLEYKFKTAPSDAVVTYAAKAFKLFLLDLSKLERRERKKKQGSEDLHLSKLFISMSVASDKDPSLRLDTDETYTIKLETKNCSLTTVDVSADSFCGLRNGLETLSQLILRDEKTGYLITYSASSVKDGPSCRYRGLMLDTARNYFPVTDLIRTVDAMAMCKLNTLHWRISDATSFPLRLDAMPQLQQYGAYANNMVYHREDVEDVVERAKIRGIRVVIEVAVPGPVGRPWIWTNKTHCPKKYSNASCDVLCVRLEMKTAVFDILEKIYREIISLTNVKDIFHLSNGLFSLSNCPDLLEGREGFLEKALQRLKLANQGFMPKLPLVWLTPQLLTKYDSDVMEKYGVQLFDLADIHNEKSLSKFKLIQSAKWDLSCSLKRMRCHKYKTWQEMYKWNSWRTLNVLAIEGGEAILWSDLVSSSGLDDVLWPRAAAVAERLWSDIILVAKLHPEVYFRLDSQRWRMLLRGINVHPIWPLWCSFNPDSCMAQIKS